MFDSFLNVSFERYQAKGLKAQIDAIVSMKSPFRVK